MSFTERHPVLITVPSHSRATTFLQTGSCRLGWCRRLPRPFRCSWSSMAWACSTRISLWSSSMRGSTCHLRSGSRCLSSVICPKRSSKQLGLKDALGSRPSGRSLCRWPRVGLLRSQRLYSSLRGTNYCLHSSWHQMKPKPSRLWFRPSRRSHEPTGSSYLRRPSFRFCRPSSSHSSCNATSCLVWPWGPSKMADQLSQTTHCQTKGTPKWGK